MSIFFSFNLFTVKLRGIEAFVTSMEAVTEKKQGYVWKSQPRSLGLVSVRRFELFRYCNRNVVRAWRSLPSRSDSFYVSVVQARDVDHPRQTFIVQYASNSLLLDSNFSLWCRSIIIKYLGPVFAACMSFLDYLSS